MACIRIKRLFGCLFICLCSIFLMSHNAFAVEFNKDVELLQANFSSQVATDHWNSISCITSPASMVFANELSCKSGILRLYSLYTKIPNRQYIDGDWIVINLQYWVSTQSSGQYNSIFTGIKYGGNNKVDLVDYEVSTASDSSTNVKLYLRVYGSFTDSDLKFVGAQGSNGIIDLIGTSTSPEIGGFIRATGVSVWHEKTAKDYSSSINDIKESVNSLNETLKQQQEQEKQEVESAVNDANNSAESNTDQIQDATGDTQASVQGVIDVIFNTGASNCEINANLGKINLGNLNMCSAPSSILNIISAVSGIIGVIVTVNVGRKVIYDVQEIIMRVTNG